MLLVIFQWQLILIYVLFAKFEESFHLKKSLKKYWKNGNKYWKSQGILSVRKSGNHENAQYNLLL